MAAVARSRPPFSGDPGRRVRVGARDPAARGSGGVRGVGGALCPCRLSWPLFAVLFLAPDLAMLGYLMGARIGAAVYNVAHTYALALPLALLGFLAGRPAILAVALIWVAHIGFDRALGFGLKYPTGFGDTHLGRSAVAYGGTSAASRRHGRHPPLLLQ